MHYTSTSNANHLHYSSSSSLAANNMHINSSSNKNRCDSKQIENNKSTRNFSDQAENCGVTAMEEKLDDFGINTVDSFQQQLHDNLPSSLSHLYSSNFSSLSKNQYSHFENQTNVKSPSSSQANSTSCGSTSSGSSINVQQTHVPNVRGDPARYGQDPARYGQIHVESQPLNTNSFNPAIGSPSDVIQSGLRTPDKILTNSQHPRPVNSNESLQKNVEKQTDFDDVITPLDIVTPLEILTPKFPIGAYVICHDNAYCAAGKIGVVVANSLQPHSFKYYLGKSTKSYIISINDKLFKAKEKHLTLYEAPNIIRHGVYQPKPQPSIPTWYHDIVHNETHYLEQSKHYDVANQMNLQRYLCQKYRIVLEELHGFRNWYIQMKIMNRQAAKTTTWKKVKVEDKKKLEEVSSPVASSGSSSPVESSNENGEIFKKMTQVIPTANDLLGLVEDEANFSDEELEDKDTEKKFHDLYRVCKQCPYRCLQSGRISVLPIGTIIKVKEIYGNSVHFVEPFPGNCEETSNGAQYIERITIIAGNIYAFFDLPNNSSLPIAAARITAERSGAFRRNIKALVLRHNLKSYNRNADPMVYIHACAESFGVKYEIYEKGLLTVSVGDANAIVIKINKNGGEGAGYSLIVERQNTQSVFYKHPELVVRRSTKNIGWNLWKLELGNVLRRERICEGDLMLDLHTSKTLQRLYLSFTGKEMVMNIKHDAFGLIKNHFHLFEHLFCYIEKSHRNVGSWDVQVLGKMWIKEATDYKRKCMREVQRTKLKDITFMSRDCQQLGLSGPPEANLSRKVPTPLKIPKFLASVAGLVGNDVALRRSKANQLEHNFSLYPILLEMCHQELKDEVRPDDPSNLAQMEREQKKREKIEEFLKHNPPPEDDDENELYKILLEKLDEEISEDIPVEEDKIKKNPSFLLQILRQPHIIDIIVEYMDIFSFFNIRMMEEKCLDFGLNYIPEKGVLSTKASDKSGTPKKITRLMLDKMWKENSKLALALMFNLGSKRGEKQDRYGFYCCMDWLWHRHPLTLLANLRHIPQMSYFKSLLEILDRVTDTKGLKLNLARKPTNRDIKWIDKKHWKANCRKITLPKRPKKLSKVELAERVLKKFDHDPLYRVLHYAIANIFVQHLKKDLEELEKGGKNYSLAAKWCPSIDSHFDERTLICETIARRLFPKTLPDYIGKTEFQYSYMVRERLRREVLSPLRLKMKVVERMISSHRSKEIEYSKLSCRTLGRYSQQFQKQDPEGFSDFLANVETFDISPHRAGPLKLALLCSQVLKGDRVNRTLCEAQWRHCQSTFEAILEDNNRDMLVAIDCSASMKLKLGEGKYNSTYVEVALSIANMVSSLTRGEFKDKVLLYSNCVKILDLSVYECLVDRVIALNSQRFSGESDFLHICDYFNENPKYMPKKLFIISDSPMRSRKAHGLQYMRNLKNEMAMNGYKFPEIIHWNMNVRHRPVMHKKDGNTSIFGYSKEILEAVLSGSSLTEQKKKSKPELFEQILKMLKRPFYNRLSIVDEYHPAESLLHLILEDSDAVWTR